MGGLFSPYEIKFDDGTLLIENGDASIPYVQWDARVNKWRAQAFRYREIIEWMNRWDPEFSIAKAKTERDQARNYRALKLSPYLEIELRPYQKEALEAWMKHGRRGTIVLPTGAGKTYLALQAIQEVALSTLVVVPTLDLMAQWHDLLSNAFDREIGLLGGGYHDLKEITISTYDSAYRYVNEFGDSFALLIFDEVHHLPGPKYLHIPKMSIAPFRLGLTATYVREDGKHAILDQLVGEPVYRLSPKDLSGDYLAEYMLIRMSVELTPQERQEYEQEYRIYRDYVEEKGLELWQEQDWQDFLKQGTYDEKARRAFMAKKRAEEIARAAKKKILMLDMLLKQHYDDRVIIFTANNRFAYQISKEFIIPTITHQTKTRERTKILNRFRSGEYSMIVTSHVLNEGIDVPAANVGIILSGSASKREYVQRLGRILRKTKDKGPARLYELIAKDTMERHISQRRRGAANAHRRSQP